MNYTQCLHEINKHRSEAIPNSPLLYSLFISCALASLSADNSTTDYSQCIKLLTYHIDSELI